LKTRGEKDTKEKKQKERHSTTYYAIDREIRAKDGNQKKKEKANK